jgi:hypothetical protein
MIKHGWQKNVVELDKDLSNLKFIKVDLLSKKRLITIFNGICVPVSSRKVSVQDPQEKEEYDLRKTKEYTEMNRLVGEGRTIINSETHEVRDFPSIADHSVYYNIFRDQNFARDLDIIPEQAAEIDREIRAAVEKLNSLRAHFESTGTKEQREAIRASATNLIQEFDSKYQSILAPQMNLINQQLLAMPLKRDGLFQLVSNSGLYSQLELTDAQRLEMYQLVSDLTEEASKQNAKMYLEAVRKIEAGFSQDQREKILSLTGVKDLKELLPPDFPRLIGHLIRARNELSADKTLRKMMEHQHK